VPEDRAALNVVDVERCGLAAEQAAADHYREQCAVAPALQCSEIGQAQKGVGLFLVQSISRSDAVGSSAFEFGDAAGDLGIKEAVIRGFRFRSGDKSNARFVYGKTLPKRPFFSDSRHPRRTASISAAR
jgi:hypothetical protein